MLSGKDVIWNEGDVWPVCKNAERLDGSSKARRCADARRLGGAAGNSPNKTIGPDLGSGRTAKRFKSI
jgi:hypothetical protein